MKKISLFLLILISTFMLVACETKTNERSAPIIEGVEDVAILQYSIFNQMAGVSARDDVDGDLTHAITVTGSVDTSKPGVYVLEYSVKNSADMQTFLERTVTVTEVEEEEEVFTFYEPTKMNDDKHIYVFNNHDTESLNNDLSFTAQVIQGLFARDRVRFYFDGRSSTNLVNTDMYHLEQTATRYDITTENIMLSDAIQMYKDAWEEYVSEGIWGSEIPLEDYNIYPTIKAYTEEPIDGEFAGYNTPGYIIYRQGTVSVNVAATLAGLTGFLPIELSQVSYAKSLGLVEKFNVDNIVFGYNWIFSVALSEINPDGLIHQDYQSPGGITNPYLKDYGVMQKYMHVYYDSATNAPGSFKNNLHRFLTPNRPILGYAYSEDSDVAFFSQFGQFLTPTDFSYNISYLTADIFRLNPDGSKLVFKQPNRSENTPVVENKHYVAFIVSDGDNATMWQNTSLFGANFLNAVGRENDTFPVTWSITPSMADLMPSILYSAYHERSNDYDHFAAPVSGHGYINAGDFLKVNDGANFTEYLSKLDIYMKKADLNVVTAIGSSGLANRIDVVNGYASVPSVRGGIIYEGHKYFGAVPGSIYWANGKPFVGPRDSLWETTPEFIAARLNLYPKTPNTIDGYSVINVHPWSHSYEDIRTIVNMLDDDVEVVSVDDLFALMTENITDKTNPNNEFKTPELNGLTITREYLESNPSLIPVNPLFNDFLLWEEDWSASSGSVVHSSSDSANSNVGNFLTSLQINANTVAKKEKLTLPNINDLWVSFVARSNSNSASESMKFTFKATIDGKTQIIIDNATLRGVQGTGTESSLQGDGWQYFAFPISQYFDDYQLKEAIFEIVNDSSLSMKIDKFEIAQKVATPNGEYNPYDNQFLNGNTEDWLLGHQYLTSQYAYWGALNKDTGRSFEDGAIQIDVSDGGGDEKRNGNTNLWMAKTFTMPSVDEVMFEWHLEGNANEPYSGVKYKVSLYVDNKYFVIQDWTRATGAMPATVINVSELTNLDLTGLTATVIIEVRDSGVNNGVGEVAWFRGFKVYEAK